MANTYMYEKMLAARQAETRHDIHLSRKPASIEHSRAFVERAAGEHDLLREAGSRHQRIEQRREAIVL